MPKRFHVTVTVNTPNYENDHHYGEADDLNKIMDDLLEYHRGCTSMVIVVVVNPKGEPNETA